MEGSAIVMSLSLRSSAGPTVMTGRDILDTDYMQRIQIDCVAPLIGHYHGALCQKNEFRVGDAVFVATGSHDGERAKTLTESGPDVLNVHGQIFVALVASVKSTEDQGHRLECISTPPPNREPGTTVSA